MRVSRTFDVTQPVAVVQGYMRDFGHTTEWDPGTVSCVRVDDGPIAVGSRWRNVSQFRGRNVELDYRLTRMEAGRLTFVGENKTATSTDDLLLAAAGEGTTVTYQATIVFHGLARLADPFMKRIFEKLADEVVAQITRSLPAA